MIFLHIGLQKTGTTSLQFLLQELQLLKFPLNKVRYVSCNNKNFYTSGNQYFLQKKSALFFEFTAVKNWQK